MKTTAYILAAALLASAPSYAADSTTGGASATVVTPLGITSGPAMSFGQFSVGATGGTIASSTTAVTSGDVVAVGGTRRHGTFEVTGLASAPYTINGDPSVTLNNGGESMTAALTYPADQSLDESGADSFNVTGVLTVNGNQPGGTYTGTYNVSVNY